MSPPPACFATDSELARESVRVPAQLAPGVSISGHGAPVARPRMQTALRRLADGFDEIAVPWGGRHAPKAEWLGEGDAIGRSAQCRRART